MGIGNSTASIGRVEFFVLGWYSNDIWYLSLVNIWSETWLIGGHAAWICEEYQVYFTFDSDRDKWIDLTFGHFTCGVLEIFENNLTVSRAELCKWLLSGEEHTRPFFFRVYEELDDEPGQDVDGLDNEIQVNSKSLFINCLPYRCI